MGLKIITEVDDILQFSEIGIVFLLFLVGLELKPRRLWNLRKTILGMGTSQFLVTSVVFMGIWLFFGLQPFAGMIVAVSFSLSSTAIALQIMTEKNLLATNVGKSSFKDRMRAFELLNLGVEVFSQETFFSALHLGEKSLIELGVPAYQAKKIAYKFKEHDNKALYEQYPFHKDEVKSISMFKQSRKDLEELFDSDEKEIIQARDSSWG